MTVTTDKQAEPDEDTVGVDDDSAVTESDDADDEAADDATDSESDEGGQRRWPRRVLVGAIALVFAASLVGSGFLGWIVWQQREAAQAGQRAQEAAVGYAQILTSIDSNKVDENFNQVLDGATGEFKDMYSQSSMQLRQLLIDNKAMAHGIVVQSAIQSQSENKVVVLLFVDQSVSNTNVPDPRIDRSRIKMTMDYVDGRWRASKVELT
jgi:Mce-associated membrane protein